MVKSIALSLSSHAPLRALPAPRATPIAEGDRLRAGAEHRFGRGAPAESGPAGPGLVADNRRAPAAVTFAAHRIAQEVLSPGLHFDDFPPALAAYAAAAGGAPAPTLRIRN
ncbi:MAG: hypothetical protein ACT4P2_01135 [Pseudomonadota bacterium]